MVIEGVKSSACILFDPILTDARVQGVDALFSSFRVQRLTVASAPVRLQSVYFPRHDRYFRSIWPSSPMHLVVGARFFLPHFVLSNGIHRTRSDRLAKEAEAGSSSFSLAILSALRSLDLNVETAELTISRPSFPFLSFPSVLRVRGQLQGNVLVREHLDPPRRAYLSRIREEG
jgi:hypothetical protein